MIIVIIGSDPVSYGSGMVIGGASPLASDALPDIEGVSSFDGIFAATIYTELIILTRMSSLQRVGEGLTEVERERFRGTKGEH